MIGDLIQLGDYDIPRIFFTADQHFGHANIIKYCNRPFANVEEMDRVLIERWNDIIGMDDFVFHLGDFTLGDRAKAASYFKQLKGKIYVLTNSWHHDKRWLRSGITNLRAMSQYPVIFLSPMVVLEVSSLKKDNYPLLAITLCHYPLAEWDRKHHGAWHLHGHSHGAYHAEGKILDVGVDNWGFAPVSMLKIVEVFTHSE